MKLCYYLTLIERKLKVQDSFNYKKFLKLPKNKYTLQVKNKLEDIYNEKFRKINKTINGYEDFIKYNKDNSNLERAKKGGLDAPFMSIYIPSSYQESGGAKQYADSLINMVAGIADAHPDKMAITTSVDQVRKNFKAGVLSLPMGMENGAPIMDDLANVQHFHDRGVRYITLTHSKVNQICDSSYDTIRTWNGLSPFGVEVVEEMNKVGIAISAVSG